MSQISGKPPPSNILKGIAWIITTVFCFAALDALTKILTQSYPAPQIVWARFVFHLFILVVVFNRRIISILKTNNLLHQLLRSGLMLTVSTLTVISLKYIPLANLSALMMTSPLIVTALSMPLLKEHVGIHRWTCVVVGFSGALIIIRPGTDVMDPVSLVVLCTALFYALYQISTRVLSRSDSNITTLFYSGIVGAVSMSFWAPYEWQPPDTQGWLLLITMVR